MQKVCLALSGWSKGHSLSTGSREGALEPVGGNGQTCRVSLHSAALCSACFGRCLRKMVNWDDEDLIAEDATALHSSSPHACSPARDQPSHPMLSFGNVRLCPGCQEIASIHDPCSKPWLLHWSHVGWQVGCVILVRVTRFLTATPESPTSHKARSQLCAPVFYRSTCNGLLE